MKKSTKDKAKGKFHEVKGAVKEKIGQATHNRKLQAKGKAEEVGGKARAKMGQAEKAMGM